LRRPRMPASVLQIPNSQSAFGIPRGIECEAPCPRRPLQHKSSPSPTCSADLATGPQFAKAILVQPDLQLLFLQTIDYCLAIVFFANKYRLGLLTHRVH